MIVIKDLCKTYDFNNTNVLDNINLEIKTNSFVALLGRSGSGKTTLMNIIGCLDKASSGQYYLDDHDTQQCSVNELAILRNRYIGFVFQQFYLLPQLNAQENVALPLFYRGIDESTRMQEAATILTKLGLGDRLTHRPSELSGGQQQRVAIARAIITDPKIILADEPTGNLDTTTGEYIMSLFNEFHQQGKTIILITHDKHIASLAHNQVHLIDGRVESIV